TPAPGSTRGPGVVVGVSPTTPIRGAGMLPAATWELLCKGSPASNRFKCSRLTARGCVHENTADLVNRVASRTRADSQPRSHERGHITSAATFPSLPIQFELRQFATHFSQVPLKHLTGVGQHEKPRAIRAESAVSETHGSGWFEGDDLLTPWQGAQSH